MSEVNADPIGSAYCVGTLIRVVCDSDRPFTAGIIIDPNTDCAIFAAPILKHLIGAPSRKLRQVFARLGWKATIVRSDPMRDARAWLET